MPVVENCKIVRQGREDRNLVFRVVIHNLLCKGRVADVLTAVKTGLLPSEALHQRLQGAVGHGLVVGRESREDFGVVPANRMIGIIHDRVEIARLAADGRSRIVYVGQVAERAVEVRVVKTLDRLTTQQVINRAVFHDQEDNGLDLVFEIGN